MNEINGFIKLYRSVLDWEWFNDNNTFRLFIYCLLKANYSDTKWRGIDIDKGSFITSYNRLSLQTGLTLQQVRTSLHKLVMTGEITHESHTKYSVIKVNNYHLYQDSNKQNDKQTNKQVTNKQQTNNKQITTDKEKKKEIKKEEKNKYEDAVFLTQEEHQKLVEKLGKTLTQEFIERLDEYIGSKGKQYKSHYKTILTWYRKEATNNPKWLDELKSEQQQQDAIVYEPKRNAEESKKRLDEL